MNDKLILSGKKILFVEDDVFVADVILLHLQNAGANIVHVDSGKEAMVALMREEFDIVLTDLAMSLGTGVDLLEFIRSNENERIKNIPVLVLTNLEKDNPLVQQASQLGVQGFFAKSSTPLPEIISKISDILGIEEGSEPPVNVNIPRDIMQ